MDIGLLLLRLTLKEVGEPNVFRIDRWEPWNSAALVSWKGA